MIDLDMFCGPDTNEDPAPVQPEIKPQIEPEVIPVEIPVPVTPVAEAVAHSTCNRMLSDIFKTHVKDYMMYTIEDRAIPSLVDGMKPVHRFFMYRVHAYAKQNKTKFNKIAAIGGGVSEIGYHHGEENANEAGKLIANTWNNNIPLIEGDGNFGSRLVKKGSASRYVFGRAHENFWKIYKDFDLCPEHKDEDHTPPAFYLPMIPMVLANGITGIAKPYATNIFPYSKDSIIEQTIAAVKGKPVKRPDICFPEFTGDIIVREDGGIIMRGRYEVLNKTTVRITEIPHYFDRLKYIEVLQKAVDDELIRGYEDKSAEFFDFEITFQRGKTPENLDDFMYSVLKLEFKDKEFIRVIDENRALRTYEDVSELIRDFVAIRIPYVHKRIQAQIERAMKDTALAKAKVEFIRLFQAGEIKLVGLTRAKAEARVNEFPELKDHTKDLLRLEIYRLTDDEANNLKKELTDLEKDLHYWNTTTPEKEYLKDLKEI